MVTIQNMLANHLSFIKQTKQDNQSLLKGVAATVVRGGGRLRTQLSAASTDATYVELLQEVFQKSEIMESWLLYFEGSQQQAIVDYLYRAGDFFSTVLLAFVIKDLHMLISAHMKKMAQLLGS